MNTTKTKERPILMSGEFVRAILGGRKTQTRRVVKGVDRAHQMPYRAAGPNIVTHVLDAPDRGLCPYGSPGDLLYVREAHATEVEARDSKWRRLVYRADRGARYFHPEPNDSPEGDAFWIPSDYDPPLGWRPSIHMPKWAARIWLRVTDVSVERVQEITNADALAEGVNGSGPPHPTEPFEEFREAWDALNADRGYGWDSDPWVWVVSFAVEERP